MLSSVFCVCASCKNSGELIKRALLLADYNDTLCFLISNAICFSQELKQDGDNITRARPGSAASTLFRKFYIQGDMLQSGPSVNGPSNVSQRLRYRESHAYDFGKCHTAPSYHTKLNACLVRVLETYLIFERPHEKFSCSC